MRRGEQRRGKEWKEEEDGRRGEGKEGRRAGGEERN
jgi:hypothetical protein